MAEVVNRPVIGRSPGFGQICSRLVLAGLLAGCLAGVFSLVVTERAIAPGLELEETRAAAGAAELDHTEQLFSRSEQLFGGFLGTVVAGIVVGLVFAVVFAAVRHRLPGRTDVARVSLLAAIGFGVFALLPALKIPANPPAVGDPDTVGTRTAIYGGVLVCGVVTTMLVAALVSWLRERGVGEAATAFVATATTGLCLALILVLVPDNPDAIAADVPAAMLWDFRLASLGQSAVLWAGLGLIGGWLVDRVTDDRLQAERDPARRRRRAAPLTTAPGTQAGRH